MTKVKGSIGTIDLKEWKTPTQLAKSEGVEPSTVRSWLFNARNNIGNKKVEFIEVEELGIFLVKMIKPK